MLTAKEILQQVQKWDLKQNFLKHTAYSVDAGSGEIVLVIDEGNSARSIVNDDMAPLRSIIVGIVDHVHIN